MGEVGGDGGELFSDHAGQVRVGQQGPVQAFLGGLAEIFDSVVGVRWAGGGRSV